MREVRIKSYVIPDDGSDGTFWRNGQRWLREGGTETPIASLAPHCEARYMASLMLDSTQSIERVAYERSLAP